MAHFRPFPMLLLCNYFYFTLLALLVVGWALGVREWITNSSFAFAKAEEQTIFRMPGTKVLLNNVHVSLGWMWLRTPCTLFPFAFSLGLIETLGLPQRDNCKRYCLGLAVITVLCASCYQSWMVSTRISTGHSTHGEPKAVESLLGWLSILFAYVSIWQIYKVPNLGRTVFVSGFSSAVILVYTGYFAYPIYSEQTLIMKIVLRETITMFGECTSAVQLRLAAKTLDNEQLQGCIQLLLVLSMVTASTCAKFLQIGGTSLSEMLVMEAIVVIVEVRQQQWLAQRKDFFDFCYTYLRICWFLICCKLQICPTSNESKESQPSVHLKGDIVHSNESSPAEVESGPQLGDLCVGWDGSKREPHPTQPERESIGPMDTNFGKLIHVTMGVEGTAIVGTVVSIVLCRISFDHRATSFDVGPVVINGLIGFVSQCIVADAVTLALLAKDDPKRITAEKLHETWKEGFTWKRLATFLATGFVITCGVTMWVLETQCAVADSEGVLFNRPPGADNAC